MKTKAVIREKLLGQKLMPLFYNPDAQVSAEVIRALYRAGIRILEYTNRRPDAYETYVHLLKVRDLEMPDLFLGIGTIKTLDAARKFIAAGADFMVSPNCNQEVINYSVVNGIFHIPGCMTPSEIASAEEAGSDFIKIFPGNLLTAEFLISVRDLFPSLYFMPTGGVEPTAESISEWFNSGASLVGMGSRLITKQLMDSGDFTKIEKQTRELLELIPRI